MISLNLLGFWDSRYYEYTQETAAKQISDYFGRGYPLDVLVIDTDWREQINNRGTGYTINKTLFPDFGSFAADAHSQGVSIVFNDHPEPTFGNKNLLDAYEIYYRNKNLKNILSKGLDYWWFDRNWWTTVNPIDEDLSRYVSGMYAYYDITKSYYESVSSGFARRPLIMANVDGIANGAFDYASALASHRYTLQWTGDIGASARSLEQEIENMVFLSVNSLLPYTSSDLGGHTSEVTPEMYMRWLEYGALSPIMRVHCTKPYSRMPWLYGEEAESVAHTFIDLRYRLLPIYYSLAHENYENGSPLMRRLDVSYPQYPEAARNDEYLIGESLLAAPLASDVQQTEDYCFTYNGEPGLKGEFFPNTELSGEPEIVTQDERIYFDWVYDAPNGLSVSDYFSVRWSGQITAGDKDIRLSAYSDDGIRIIIDGQTVVDGWDAYDTTFTTGYIPANSTHDITVEYFDGNNHAHIFITAYSDEAPLRTVFIPDGNWVNVFTGEVYAGPETYEISCPLDETLLFVRRGSVLTLADNMKNTSSGNWSHLTLEVFPGETSGESAVLYEDDTETVAYKDGHFRTTDITLSGDNRQTLTISPASGSFEGGLCFNERSYTVRVHGRDDWGELTGAALNGKPIEFSFISRDITASPLAIKGGARDADIWELSFTADVYKESVIELFFASSSPDNSSEYSSTATGFSVSQNTVNRDVFSLSLSSELSGYLVASASASMNEERSESGDGSIGELTVFGRKWLMDDGFPITWESGNEAKTGRYGLVSNREFGVTLNSDGENTFRLYLGGYKGLGKLTVKDGSGAVKTIVFGDNDGVFEREITIKTESQGELFVTYTLLSGQNVNFSAIVKE